MTNMPISDAVSRELQKIAQELAAGPTPFQVFSQILVPVILAGASLAVAIFGLTVAKTSNRIARDASATADRAVRAEERLRRAAYIHVLLQVSYAILGVRFVGGSTDDIFNAMNPFHRELNEKQLLADHSSAVHFTEWVSNKARTSPLQVRDVKEWTRLGSEINERARLWINDPDEAMKGLPQREETTGQKVD